MTDKNYNIFRCNYENKISKKLEIDKEQFYSNYYETKQPFGLAIFGFLMLVFALYILLKINTLYGILLIIIGCFFIYGALKKSKLVFRISKNGIWTPEFGFIYFRHIERFEFYRYIGKNSSERMKIHIKNYKIYKMEIPFLEQAISHIDNYGSLKEKLNNALIIVNKRSEDKHYRS
ncbi:hypothetical protein ASG22_16475 [Chryseobacterium sp. Leaf405]|uniref:hypothetical protein n=1 Tax=Chryseobacterium sp. Leaf405 TaxID=1736367 RepID=UPI0006F3B312|nr:hypothetical protein [Chryseobacterium sp. Leaf405]KQT21008.1 hypothetical protein ASG22_16475 [Chryseobacterium sp. Leaf405]